MSFSFFGTVDKGSQFPAWTMTNQLNELKEEYGYKERTRKAGLVDPANVPYHMEEMGKLKSKIEGIDKSRPKLTATEKRKVEEEYSKLKNMIADSLFTRSDMKLGLADPHEEARRMITPLFEVDSEVAKACNVKLEGGKVSRNDATKMYKIIGHYLGDATNVEYLRKNG